MTPMNEENTRPQAAQEQPEAQAPAAAEAAPAAEQTAETAEPKPEKTDKADKTEKEKKDWFGKKNRELESLKAKLETAENKAAELNGGTVAVAAYTAVSYVTFVAMRLIQGVGDGAQPLLSYFEGRGDMRTKHAVLAYGLVSTAVITLPVTLLCIFLRAPLSGLFGLSQEGRDLFSQALLVMILPLAAFGLMRIAMSYFYAQDKNLFSNILVYGEPVIVAAVVFTLPSACGLSGIWLSAPISQVFLALLALAFLASMLRRERARRLPPA